MVSRVVKLARQREANKRYQERHPDRIKAFKKRYRANNKAKIKKYEREYLIKNRDKINSQKRKTYRRDVRQTMFNLAKGRAKRLGIIFKIKVEDIKIPKICPILKIPLIQNIGKAWVNSPTLDRVNNKRGYIKGNIRVICQKANRCKSDLKITQVKRLLAYMKGEI